VGTLFMKLFQEKAKELLRVLLMTSVHVAKAWQFSDCRIDVFWGESITKIFKVFRLESKSELVHRSSGVNDFKLAHKQNPKTKSATASFPGGAVSLHRINYRGIAFELVSGLLGNLVEEVVEWDAKYQDLKNLERVSKTNRLWRRT
jgi:hypothetical protein